MTGLSGRSKFGAVFVPIILLFLISGLNITTAYAQGTDVCESPDDKPWTGCLTEIAKYTAWMVVPSTDVSPGDLQSAIDGIYGDLQQEWTGPLRSRTHVRWLFLMVPGGLLAYLIIIFVVSRLFPPRFPPGGDPIWTAEKLMIVLAGLIICCVWIAERMYSYEEMNAQYRIVSDAITPFIHLRAPAQLANATSNPCEAIYKDSDLLLGLCRQEWASGARLALGRLLKSRFAKESLLQSLIAIGRRCQNVQIPKWWDSGYADEGERVMKLGL